ncbi:hypothetical protein Htur_1718 [Haloterrigena turkmenica DSM 5511]|uniref:DUF7998 domain-containing protein n=1 Tax=Haloterrigena turkmenica (strain ATCC 51198 / DSM 5511 / JCM 9101 / NCIMB 13204 / VKM B-1734 / 4k) TaxID=543526 RepID=D2RS22_HALTV|nr:hypothetical protein [Haloterrigena turkmenica]ADB60603.1 hypothetical protein Htur_1718 [Haloterrigena turkmenica DSM 5511]
MFGRGYWTDAAVFATVMNPFTRSTTPGGDGFEPWDAFDPDHAPAPGPFLEGHDVLAGDDHLAFHRLTRELFEERGVYDATFGYNLARLNLDRRHPEAGFRYAVDADDPSILRAEFTPTTEFCPQAEALVTGAFRAWNGLADRHEYELVRVRAHPSHHQSDALDAELERLETEFRETGTVPGAEADADAATDDGTTPQSPF